MRTTAELEGVKSAPIKIAIVASETEEAKLAARQLAERYGDVPLGDADVVVALGGDGLMLQTMHQLMGSGKPIFGMNRGSVGFLMNDYRATGLTTRLAKAERSVVNPLLMHATSVDGEVHTARAINEVHLIRQSYQAAKLRIAIDGRPRLEELIADGVLVATPAGSTAYNLSVRGPIVPLNSPLLALTAISPFRPRRWTGALLPDKAQVTVTVIDPEKRPVAAFADHTEIKAVREVRVALDRETDIIILHDPGHSLDERILREQFGD
jgi:NAD+ kinase